MSPGEDFAFSVAGPSDEPDIRRLVAATPMPGSITVRFEREPDYFLGCTVMGDVCDVLMARHQPDGELAGIVCRSERTLLVNGQERRVGSIGQVRVAAGYRGRWLLHRGLPLLHERGPADLLYIGVVTRENRRARAVMLERRPPGGLHRRLLSGITTSALMLRGPSGTWGRSARPAGLTLGRVTLRSLEELVVFLRRVGARRQLFPAYRVEDFLDGRTMRGLDLADLAVARRGGGIVGCLGMWDQSAFKQDVVHAYAPTLRRLRPAWDIAARVVGAATLPREGQPLPFAFATCVCVEDDDPDVLRALLRSAAGRAAARGRAFLLLGLADADPLLQAVGRWPRITYRSDLFAFSWADVGPGDDLDGRTPYVEIGTL